MSFNEFLKAAKKDPSLRSEIRVQVRGKFVGLKPEKDPNDAVPKELLISSPQIQDKQ